MLNSSKTNKKEIKRIEEKTDGKRENNEKLIRMGFKAIKNFVAELEKSYGNKYRSLKLYSRLLSKTTMKHSHIVKKHFLIFKLFCMKNRDALEHKDENKLKGNLRYSDNVYINIQTILKISDPVETKLIWQHLYALSAITDRSGKAKEWLKNSMKKTSTGKNETKFLNNIFNQVEQHVKPNANPMEAIGSVLGSGMFQDLMGNMNKGLESGDLDLGKLMGTVSGMVTNLGNMTNKNPEMQALNPLISNMSNMVDTLNKKVKIIEEKKAHLKKRNINTRMIKGKK